MAKLCKILFVAPIDNVVVAGLMYYIKRCKTLNSTGTVGYFAPVLWTICPTSLGLQFLPQFATYQMPDLVVLSLVSSGRYARRISVHTAGTKSAPLSRWISATPDLLHQV